MRFTVLSLLTVLPLAGCGAGVPGEAPAASASESSAVRQTSTPAAASPAKPSPAPVAAAPAGDALSAVAARAEAGAAEDMAAHRRALEAAKLAGQDHDEAAHAKEALQGQNLVVAPAPSGMPRTAPRLLIPEKEKDFGTMLDGEVATHEFRFENAGDAPLTISRVQPSCGCTLSEVKIGEVRYEFGKSIPPGASGTIGARFDSRGQHGTQAKTLVVYSDDPSGPATLRFQAMVESFFVLEPNPPTLNFGTVFVGETKSMTLTVRSDRVESFHPTGAGQLPAGLGVTWEPLEAGEENAWKLTATLGEGLHEGTFTHRVSVQTDAGRPVDFYVTASVSGPIQVLPNNYILFGLIGQGTKTARSVELLARDGEPPIDVTGTTLEVQERGGTAPKNLAEFFEVNVRPVEEGKRYMVEVIALETLPLGVFGGTLRIQLNHPAIPSKDVVLSGFVR